MAYFSEVAFTERRHVECEQLKESIEATVFSINGLFLTGSLARSCFCFLEYKNHCSLLSDIDLISIRSESELPVSNIKASLSTHLEAFEINNIEAPYISIKYVKDNSKYLEDYVFLCPVNGSLFDGDSSGAPSATDIENMGYLHMIAKILITRKESPRFKKLYYISKTLRPVNDIFYVRDGGSALFYNDSELKKYILQNYEKIDSFISRFLNQKERGYMYKLITNSVIPESRNASKNEYCNGSVIRKAWEFTQSELPNTRVAGVLEQATLASRAIKKQ